MIVSLVKSLHDQPLFVNSKALKKSPMLFHTGDLCFLSQLTMGIIYQRNRVSSYPA